MKTFANHTKCTAVAAGCYSYCRDTCFRSVRYEVDAAASAGLTLKVCRLGHGKTCAYFAGGLRVNENVNAVADPRTFIAHLPLLVGYTYKAIFVDSSDQRVQITPLLSQYEESFCPAGDYTVYLDGNEPDAPYTTPSWSQ